MARRCYGCLAVWVILAMLAGISWGEPPEASSDTAPAPAPSAGETPADSPDAPPETSTPTEAKLRIGYPAGSWILKQKHSSESVTFVDEMKQPIQKTKMTLTLSLEVAPADGKGHIPVEIRFRRIEMNVKVGNIEMKYDSADQHKQHKLLKDLLGPMLSAKIDMTLDAGGSVLEVRNATALWEKVLDANPAVAPMLANIQSFLGDVGGKIAGTGSVLPDRVVQLDEEWDTEVTGKTRLWGETSAKWRCKLEKIASTDDGPVATVSFRGATQGVPSADPLALAGANVAIESFDADQKGSLRVHVASGRPLSYGIEQKAKISLTVKRGRREQKVEVSRDTKLDWTLSESKPAPVPTPTPAAP